MKLRNKLEITSLITVIVMLAVALLIFAYIAPSVNDALSIGVAGKSKGNYTENPTAGAIVPLISIVFIAGVILAVIKGFLA